MDRKGEIREMIDNCDGTLIVKEYPTKTATTNTIRAHLEKLKQQDITPDMIIVDYADLLRPLSARDAKREELESIYEELRAIMMENDVVDGQPHKQTEQDCKQKLLQCNQSQKHLTSALLQTLSSQYQEQQKINKRMAEEFILRKTEMAKTV